jgi:hypothetical protein
MSPLNTISFHHRKHQAWINKLDLYQDEIYILKKELESILLEFSDLFSIMEYVDEYQKILNKKLEQMGEFRQQINLHERQLKGEYIFKQEELWDNLELQEKLNYFSENFNTVKNSFRKFVASHLHSKN